jgi:hypothetical protein
VELLLDGEPRATVEVELVGYTLETTTATMRGGPDVADGGKQWEGHVVGGLGGLTEFDVVMAGAFALKLPDERIADVVFQDARRFTGSGPAPFDM